MRDMGFRGAIRGKPLRTTTSDKAAPCPLDHVNRQFHASAPDRLWLADFTYVATWAGFVYVAFVIDAYARRIATAPLAGGATVFGSAGGFMREQLAPWLASYPQTIGEPPFVSLIAAGVLVSGFGTRIIAGALAVAVPLSQATMQLDERLYWVLALGILILRGPGPFSFDRLIEEAFRRAARREAPKDRSLPHVVVVGGGFGGLAAARGLAGTACRVTLIDRRNYHLFQPLLYQVATAGLSPADIATPIRSLFRLQRNVRVLLGEVAVS